MVSLQLCMLLGMSSSSGELVGGGGRLGYQESDLTLLQHVFVVDPLVREVYVKKRGGRKARNRVRAELQARCRTLTRSVLLTKQPCAIASSTPHDLLLSARMERQVGCNVVHDAIQNRPCILRFVVGLDIR